MKLPWKRITEIRGRGGEKPEGLEYEYPCCGGTVFVSHEKLIDYLNAPHDEAVDPAPVVCPTCPEVDEAVEDSAPGPSNVISFEAKS